MSLQLFLKTSLGIFFNESRIGVQKDGDMLWIARTTGRRKSRQLDNYFRLTLPSGSFQEKADFLKARWEQEGLDAEEFTLAFSHREAIVKMITLPSIDPGELREMVRLHVARQTPFGISELVFGYKTVARTSEGFSRVLLVIARKEEVEQHIAVFQAAGLKPKRIVLDSLAAVSFMHIEEKGKGLSLCVQVNNGNAFLGIFDGDSLRYLRAISLPFLPPENDSEQWRNIFQEELQQTLLAAAIDPESRNIPHAEIAGENMMALLAQEVVQHELGSPSLFINPAERIALPLKLAREGGAFSWAAIGASFQSAGDASFTLLPDKQRQQLTHAERRRDILGILAWSFVFLGTMSAAIGQRFYRQTQELKRLSQSCALLASETKELRQMERSLDSMKAGMNQQGSFLNLMRDVEHLLPPEVSLHSIDFEQGQSLLLQGTCFSLSQTVSVVEALQKSASFSSVELRSSEVQRVNDKDLVGFTVACQLSSKFHAKA